MRPFGPALSLDSSGYSVEKLNKVQVFRIIHVLRSIFRYVNNSTDWGITKMTISKSKTILRLFAHRATAAALSFPALSSAQDGPLIAEAAYWRKLPLQQESARRIFRTLECLSARWLNPTWTQAYDVGAAVGFGGLWTACHFNGDKIFMLGLKWFRQST
jgi:hypothetical protein